MDANDVFGLLVLFCFYFTPLIIALIQREKNFIVRAARTYCETDNSISLIDNVTAFYEDNSFRGVHSL